MLYFYFSMSETVQGLGLGTKEAAGGRFLLAPEALQLYLDTQTFWCDNCDLLPSSVGVIYQASRKSSDLLTPPTTTLLLDARRERSGLFSWQLTEAPGSGRTIVQVSDTAMRYHLDPQGRLIRIEEASVREVAPIIVEILQGPEVNRQITEIRERRSRAERALERFAVHAIARHRRVLHPQTNVTELDAYEMAANEIGFLPSFPYVPPRM